MPPKVLDFSLEQLKVLLNKGGMFKKWGAHLLKRKKNKALVDVRCKKEGTSL